MSLDRFVADLDALLRNPTAAPATAMRMRFVRSWAGASPASMLMARRAESSLKVLLYAASATATTRPAWECFIDPLTDLEASGQRCACDVLGVIAPGRAVVLRVNGALVPAVSPLRPVLRGRRFGSDT